MKKILKMTTLGLGKQLTSLGAMPFSQRYTPMPTSAM